MDEDGGQHKWQRPEGGDKYEERIAGEEETKKSDDDIEEEVEEVRKPKVGRIPTAPTKRELEEHLPLHMPYKAWCPVCVAGEGIHNQSRQTKEDEKERIGITVSMD